MTSAGGLDVRQGAASGPVDVAGPPASGAISAPGTQPTAANLRAACPTTAPPALDPGGAACPTCGSQLDALVLIPGDRDPILGCCRACGWGATANALRHLKPLPEDAE